MGIGFSLFLFVVGAILTFAVDVNTSSGFSIDTVAGGDRVVEERRIEREF